MPMSASLIEKRLDQVFSLSMILLMGIAIFQEFDNLHVPAGVIAFSIIPVYIPIKGYFWLIRKIRARLEAGEEQNMPDTKIEEQSRGRIPSCVMDWDVSTQRIVADLDHKKSLGYMYRWYCLDCDAQDCLSRMEPYVGDEERRRKEQAFYLG